MQKNSKSTSQKKSSKRVVPTNRKHTAKMKLSIVKNHIAKILELDSVLAFSEQKKSKERKGEDVKVDPLLDLRLSLISTARSFIGVEPITFFSGGVTNIGTTSANVVQYAVNSQTYLPCALTSALEPELSSFQVLFDEIKVMGVRFQYRPFARYGTTTVSAMMAIVWDDDSNTTPTTTVAGFAGAIGGRNFELMHVLDSCSSSTGSFRRPGPESDYPWSDLQSFVSTDPALRGSMFLASDGSITASKTLGHILYQFEIHVRLRI
jgi:hypothetical protein